MGDDGSGNEAMALREDWQSGRITKKIVINLLSPFLPLLSKYARGTLVFKPWARRCSSIFVGLEGESNWDGG
jgi:hypothetical protein